MRALNFGGYRKSLKLRAIQGSSRSGISLSWARQVRCDAFVGGKSLAQPTVANTDIRLLVFFLPAEVRYWFGERFGFT
eukprot:874748-Pyramimonas_sp.AAC.1